jgi:hypothetical protein
MGIIATIDLGQAITREVVRPRNCNKRMGENVFRCETTTT